MTRYTSIALAAVALSLAACSPASSDANQTAGTPEAGDAAVPAATAFSPADLTGLIDARGADGALGDMMAEPEDARWQALLGGVSSGDVAWIEAAGPLVAVFDGEAAESGFAALGAALAHQPEAVLAAVGPDGMASTCQPYPPEETAAKETALMAIPEDSPVLALRDECLTVLSGEPT